MSMMNNLDLKLKELETQIGQVKEDVQSIRELLSSNEHEASSDDGQPKRNPVQDKVTVRQMLAEKCKKGYTDQIKDLLHKFGAERLSEVDPKDYEDIYYSAEGIGQ